LVLAAILDGLRKKWQTGKEIIAVLTYDQGTEVGKEIEQVECWGLGTKSLVQKEIREGKFATRRKYGVTSYNFGRRNVLTET